MSRLEDDAISTGLSGLDWTRTGNAIESVRTFADFAAAMAWVTRVADLAEARNHHPDIAISWNRVTLTLSTHSAGGLTAKDLEMAEAIDTMAEPPS